MPQAQLITSLALGGLSIQPPPIQRTFDHPNPYSVALEAAKPLTSWVKTDANTAAGNLPSGHGWSNGNFDVYWTGGRRLGVPGTISTNALTLDGGAGTDFPDSGNTTVVVVPQTVINSHIDGDAIKIIGIMLESLDAAAEGVVEFFDVGDAKIATVELAKDDPTIIDVEGGASNPFTGNPITYALASQNSTSQPGTLKILSGEDSTP